MYLDPGLKTSLGLVFIGRVGSGGFQFSNKLISNLPFNEDLRYFFYVVLSCGCYCLCYGCFALLVGKLAIFD